jgi:serine/threonine protein kinase
MHGMIPVKTIGRYEVLEELGHGAMGSVFKANDPAMGRTVALKTILAAALAGDKGEEYRARFYREAHAAGKLAHPGIVPVFDVGEQDGTPFLVMEFVEGRTLSAAAWGGERFTLDRTCEVGQQIAEALGYAHRKGVIHRDIKPANILMTSPEAYGSERARITDFGVAKLTAGDMTSTGQLLGTPAFMPPEQYTGAQVDGRADLFSLGVILYSLATGERPFTGDTMTAVSYKVVHTEPVPPRRLNPSIPSRLEEVILKCLAKDPAERFQTGDELAQELAALRGVPVTDSAMRRTVAVRTVSGTDATIDSAAGQTAASTLPWNQPMGVEPPSTSPASPAVAKGGLRVGALAAIAAVVVAALAAGGWLLARRSTPPAAQTPAAAQSTAVPAPASAPVSAPVSEPASATVAAPVAATVQTAAASPAHAKTVAAHAPAPKPAAPADAPSPRTQAAAAAAPAAAAPAVDPRTLDPKANARLKIELNHFPAGVPFTIELNHKPYLNANSGDKSSFDNVYVPPGVQEFRVVLKAGGQRKVSNIVSDEFKAKKHKTLKIQLQDPAGSKAAPGPDAQVVAALK